MATTKHGGANPPQYIKPPPKSHTSLTSCVLATIFITFLAILALILYFTLLNPKPPTISITAVNLPSFSYSNRSTSTTTAATNAISFTFSQYAAVSNPNHYAAFDHYDSSIKLEYQGRQVGSMNVPAGTIGAGRTEYMAATFAVESFPLSSGQADDGLLSGFRVGRRSVEVESRLEMKGRVKLMGWYNRRVGAEAVCRVVISVGDGSVMGFHCS